MPVNSKQKSNKSNEFKNNFQRKRINNEELNYEDKCYCFGDFTRFL